MPAMRPPADAAEPAPLRDFDDAARVVAANTPGEVRGVVVWTSARALLREFRPQVWVVLQDMAHDADWCGDRLVASTSARLVADHLAINPATAAAALQVLRERGFAELIQSSGAAGRFGLAAYRLRLPRGMEALSPRVDPPCVDPAHTAEKTSPSLDLAPVRSRRHRPATLGQFPQGTLDFGVGDQ